MTVPNRDAGSEQADRWSAMSDDQIVERLRETGADELDAQTQRLLDRISDQVLASVRDHIGLPNGGASSRGNSAA